MNRTVPSPSRERDSVRARVLNTLLVVALLAGAGAVSYATNAAQTIGSWLVWRYLGYIALTLVWAASSTSAGFALLRRLLKTSVPVRVRWLFSFGVGVMLFGTAIEVIGFVGLLRWPAFVLLPLALGASGARPLFREARVFFRRIARRRRPIAILDLALAAAVLLAMALLYTKVVSPNHAGYDSRWYHLPGAEHYATSGSVRAFPEGWILGAYPQLMTFLYTWAFLLPRGTLFDHVTLGGHIEFTLIIGLLGALSLTARQATGTRHGFRAMTLLFGFPAIFMYGPQCEADMLATFYGALTALAVLRFWRRPVQTEAILAGFALAGLLVTKYSTAAALVPAALIIGLRFCSIREKAWALSARLKIAGTWGAVFVAATSPHWLKNWAFYGDPLFPLLIKHLPAHPLTKQGRDILTYFWPHEVWRPEPNWGGLKESANAAFTFAFSPHEYVSVGHGWPLFGFLFTCAFFALPFARARLEIWLLALGTTLGVFVWFWVHHQDRYLQVLLGWMVPVVFAVVQRAWQTGFPARAAVTLLLTIQLAWGGDVFFHHAPLASLLELITSARRGPEERSEQMKVFRPMADVARALPKGEPNKVLVHEMHDHLGLGAPSVSDFAGWQTGISYVEASSPAAVHQLLTSMGVTHLLFHPGNSTGMSSLGADIAFFRYVRHFAGEGQSVGPFTLARIASHTPEAIAAATDFAYVIDCGSGYRSGLYPISHLDVRTVDPPPASEYPLPTVPLDGQTAPDRPVAAVTLNSQCHLHPAFLHGHSGAENKYELVAHSGSIEIWLAK